MDDTQLLQQIHDLVNEEHHLEEAHQGTRLSPEEQQRLRELEIALDRCWDLLRQRRARREFGQDPETAAPRPTEVVEGYQQ